MLSGHLTKLGYKQVAVLDCTNSVAPGTPVKLIRTNGASTIVLIVRAIGKAEGKTIYEFEKPSGGGIHARMDDPPRNRTTVDETESEQKRRLRVGDFWRVDYGSATTRKPHQPSAVPAAFRSKRSDRRGHWPKGKPQSTLSIANRAMVVRELRRACVTQSKRSVALKLGVSDRSVRRILAGEDQPSQRLYDLVKNLIEPT